MVSLSQHFRNSTIVVQYDTEHSDLLIHAVVGVRFVQAEYFVSRGAGSVRVCLTKDLQTVTSLSITIFTEDGTAQSV